MCMSRLIRMRALGILLTIWKQLSKNQCPTMFTHSRIYPPMNNEASLDCWPPTKGRSNHRNCCITTCPHYYNGDDVFPSHADAFLHRQIFHGGFYCRMMCWSQLAGMNVLMDVTNLCLERNVSRLTKKIVTSATGSNSPSNNPLLRSKPVTIPFMHHAFSSVPWPGKVNWSNSLQHVPPSKVLTLSSSDEW